MQLGAILPELVLGGSCLALVPAAGFARDRGRGLPAAGAALALGAAIVLTARMLPWDPVSTFDGTYAVDGFAHVFKLLVLSASLVTLVASAGYFRGRPQAPHAPVALLFTTLGAVGLSSSLDLGLVLLFLQMTSMGIYVLTALVRSDARGLEAALKYFVYGAVALAVMAYGLTFLYGMTGSLDLREIGDGLRGADPAWVLLALALVVVGYGFEMTMVPFHPWAPEVLEGATAPIAGFVSVVPKIGATAGLLRILLEGFAGGLASWPIVVGVLAAGTMTLGNLAALRQRRLKRLLAWSTVAQSGYVLVAVAVGERADLALPAVGYYLAAYLFMNLGAFVVVARLERAGGDDEFETFRGLARRAPAAAAALALALLSLAGIPPLAGFAGKVLVLTAAVDGGMTWLAVLGAANMAVAIYYYARVVAEMYMKPPVDDGPLPGQPGLAAAAAACTLGTLILGILPGPILDRVLAIAETL